MDSLTLDGFPISQPKKQMGDYLEKRGFDVPKRYETLNDARSNAVSYIIRSEHPQDLKGISGLLESLHIRAGKDKEVQRFLNTEFLSAMIKKYHVSYEKFQFAYANMPFLNDADTREIMLALSVTNIDRYCTYTDTNVTALEEETSYSYWEHIFGNNRTIIEDSAIQNRYHIMTVFWNGREDYSIVENGVATSLTNERGGASPSDLHELVDLYKSVSREVPYGLENCLCLEIQTALETNRHYVLQVLYTRNRDPSRFRIDKIPDCAIPTMFVRGKTEKEGVECDLHIFTNPLPSRIPTVDAAFDFHYNPVFKALESQQNRVHCVSARSVKDKLHAIAGKHADRSELFRPATSCLIKVDVLLTQEEKKQMMSDAQLALPVRFTIDGRRGYCERVGSLVQKELEGYSPREPWTTKEVTDDTLVGNPQTMMFPDMHEPRGQ